MPLRSNTALGLDIGQSTTKMVLLSGPGGKPKVLKSAVFRNWEEGIVSHDELAAHLGDWLAEHGAGSAEITLGVPQYLAIVQLSDFPPASAQQLDEMVRLETQQVAGLSDEAFLHDYSRLEPFDKQSNPVLIGVCRESVIRDRLEPLTEHDLKICDLTMDGQALAFAYQDLVPAADQKGALHMVVDVGTENSTLALMQDGQCVHVATFLAGGQTFTTAMSRHLQIGEEEAERTKRESRILMGHLDSPLTQAARQFTTELHAALENWRFHGQQEADSGEESALPFDRIYLCGGGARLPGLHEYMGNLFECEVHRLQLRGGDEEDAELLAVAYGLAASALKAPEDRISLAPPDLTWFAQRKRRVSLLGIGYVGLLVAIVTYLLTSFLAETRRSVQLDRTKQQLAEARTLMQGLEQSKAEVRQMQKMLIPFAARGNRNATFNAAIAQLGQYQQPGDWLLFLADQESYYGRKVTPRTEMQAAPSRQIFGTASDGPVMDKDLILTSDMVPWRSLMASGFTPQNPEAPFANVSQTVKDLNSQPDSIFQNVDTITESQRSLLDFRLVPTWREHFDMKSFAIKLPLKHVSYRPENLD